MLNSIKTSVICDQITCSLGESPLWDSEQQRILWVDIKKNQLHHFYPASARHVSVDLQQMVTAIAFTDIGLLIAATQHGFAFINPDNGLCEDILDTIELSKTNNRFNDGKCDPDGRFWAGTMSTKGEKGKGALYMLDQQLDVHDRLKGVSVSNGMAWDAGKRIFYYIDTPKQQIVAYDYNLNKGLITQNRIVVDIPEAMGKPDGMTIDSEGKLWVAIWGGGRITQWDPETGDLIQTVFLPTKYITSCTFGGQDFSELYVTTAAPDDMQSQETSTQQYAGKLFRVKNTGSRGIESYKFKTSK